MELMTEFVMELPDDQPGGGDGGVVEQPAKKISAPQKMIPAVLNTRPLCGMRKRTQVVSGATCLRSRIQP
jgi:hypothetical protein